MNRSLLVGVGYIKNRLRHCGRKECSLVILRNFLKNSLNILTETHV